MTHTAELVMAIIGAWFTVSIGLGALLVVQHVRRERREAGGRAPLAVAHSVDFDHLN